MISVCMATYNGEKYVAEQVFSILEQLGPSDEIIISDDGSKDRTIEILQDINDKRVKIYRNIGEHGVSANFNNAVKHSTGDYVFFSDQDDIWEPNKVEVVMKKLNNCDLVVHNASLVNSDNKYLGQTYFSYLPVKIGFIANLWKFHFLGSCMAVNRNALLKILPFPTNPYVLHDYWMYMAMKFKGFRIECIPDALIRYRRHENTVTSSGNKSKTTVCFKFKKRINLLLLLATKFIF